MNKAVAIASGKIDLPMHMRGKSTILQHGTRVQVLDDRPNGDPQKVIVRLEGGREYTIDKRFVSFS